MVDDPDRPVAIIFTSGTTGLPKGALRFILSLRATGEGHISSITFRVGVISAQDRITLTPPVAFATEPERVPNATYDKPLFARKLQELGVQNKFCRCVLDQLDDAFTMNDLRRVLAVERKRTDAADATADRAFFRLKGHLIAKRLSIRGLQCINPDDR